MTSQNRVKSNCDVLANFSLIFRNSEFIMKNKFPSYETQKFSLFNNTKILELDNFGIKVSLKVPNCFLERII